MGNWLHLLFNLRVIGNHNPNFNKALYILPLVLGYGWLVIRLRVRQEGWHFPDDIFKCIFLNENVWISIRISLNFVSKSLINSIPALVQIMAWRRSGDKPLLETVMDKSLTHSCVTRPQWVKAQILRGCYQLSISYNHYGFNESLLMKWSWDWMRGTTVWLQWRGCVE